MAKNERPAVSDEAPAPTDNGTAASAATNFQPMPSLSPEQLEALKSDIECNGVLVPVVVDQHSRIIDGNNRAAIAAELGIDYPVTVVKVSDDDDAYDRAVSLNCARRHLNREQTRDLIRSELLRRTKDSDRAIARRVGCSPSTVGSVRAEVRREFEDGAEEIREEIKRMSGQIAAAAYLQHLEERHNWQTVGDLLERSTMMQLSKLDTEWWTVVWKPLWKVSFGPFFDEIRATDCEPSCTVCTPFDREWRDTHPHRVYRWSTPDAEAAAE